MQHFGFSLWLTECSLIISASCQRFVPEKSRRDSEAAQSNSPTRLLHSWLYQSKPGAGGAESTDRLDFKKSCSQTDNVSNVGGRKSLTGKQKMSARQAPSRTLFPVARPNSCCSSSLWTTWREMCMLWCCAAPSEHRQHRQHHQHQRSMNRQHIVCFYPAAVWTQATWGCYKHSESSSCSDPL